MGTVAGFLNVLKPPGMTSHDVVYQVRRRLPRGVKVGHLGTLDPAATGVLPLAIGSATRLIPLLPDRGAIMKGYLAEIALGVSTSTDDLEGQVLERHSAAHLGGWSELEWDAQLAPFRGTIAQVPPQVSAIRTDGKRAYDRVRQGETLTLAARQVTVSRCAFRSWSQQAAEGRLGIFLLCSSGTYVRSIARDLGRTLGVGGALAFLVRTLSGPFSLPSAVTLEELQATPLEHHLLPESFPFMELPLLDQEVRERGQELSGELFESGHRYRARNGVLLGLPKGRAVVEAVFSGGRA